MYAKASYSCKAAPIKFLSKRYGDPIIINYQTHPLFYDVGLLLEPFNPLTVPVITRRKQQRLRSIFLPASAVFETTLFVPFAKQKAR